MKRNDSQLVHVQRGAELARATYPDPSKNPARVYMASLSKDSIPAMKAGLRAIARIIHKSADWDTLPWHELRFSHTRAVRSKLIETYEPRTVNRTISGLRGVLKAAWNLELMSTDDYMRAIQVPHTNTSHLPPAGRHLEIDEIKKLLQAARSEPEPLNFRDQALIVFMYAGGLRRQEASALDLADYDLKTGAFEVRRGKRGKYRDLAIAEGYRDWLVPWVSYQKARRSEAMFVRWSGSEKRAAHGHPTMFRLGRVGIDHALARVRELAGVAEFTPHDLRRSFATTLLDSGVDVMIVQDLMGHANLNTTKLYDRRGQKTRRAAVENLPVALRYEDIAQ